MQQQEKRQKVRSPVTGNMVYDTLENEKAREAYYEKKRRGEENREHLYGQYPTVGKQGPNVEIQEWHPVEVAEYYKVTPSTIYGWIRDGVIQAEKRMSLTGKTTRYYYIIYNAELLRLANLAQELEPYIRRVFPRAIIKGLAMREAEKQQP